MRIGIIIGRIGGVDGVALETEKWMEVLGRLGHQVFVLVGKLEGELKPSETCEVFEPLSFEDPECRWAQRVAFGPSELGEGELLDRLQARADHIAAAIEAWLDAKDIECILSENASALPYHLQMGMAIQQVVERRRIATVSHDHDFAWERGQRYASRYPGVQAIIGRCFPMNHPSVRHAVINKAAKGTLRKTGIKATVVPNVMDFEESFGQRDAYNATLRPDLGLSDDDIVLFQVTRIVRRKGIDTAIELVHRLKDPRVKLVITGNAYDDDGSGYVVELHNQVRDMALEDQVLFAGDRFDSVRRTAANGERVYSLSDAYAQADACTYFSTYEGFGNAFVETVLAKRPIFVNNYVPVYWPDIGAFGFDAVMIEGSRLTDKALTEIREVLDDSARRERMVEKNFALGARYFSFEALERLLQRIFV